MASVLSLVLEPLEISMGRQVYTTAPLAVELQTLKGDAAAGVVLAANLSTAGVGIDLDGRKVQLQSARATLDLTPEKLDCEVSFSPTGIPGRFSGRLNYEPSTGRGSFSLKTSQRLDLASSNSRLSNLLSPWPYPFDLDQGRIAGTVQGRWKPGSPLVLDGFISITKGAGYYQKHLFEGLELRQDLAILPTLRSRSRGSFSLKRLIGAVDTHALRADVNFVPSASGPRPMLLIHDFSASIFDGTISVDQVRYDLNQPDTACTVKINKIDLARIIDLINIHTLHVGGRISGSIPIRIRGREITVDHGELHNEPPGGEIRYTPPQGGEPGGITGYALKAVEDFRYTSLTAVARYSASGLLELDIGLQGTSPGLETSRPVHLNIHAEQNLPDLIKSLRFSRGLTEKLDKRIKQHYK